jgi:1,4-alpha-glucan branching enzyme
VRSTVSLDGMNALLDMQLRNPTDVLGPRTIVRDGRQMLSVRAFLPGSRQAWLLDTPHAPGRPMRRIHPAGLYEAICPLDAAGGVNQYQLRIADHEGAMTTVHDPYAFRTHLTDFDLHLFGEGKLLRCYD